MEFGHIVSGGAGNLDGFLLWYSGLAWVLLGFTVVTFIPGWYVLVWPICKAGLREYFIAALRPLLIAGVAIAPAYFIIMPMTNVYLHMSVAVFISAPLYLGLSLFLNSEWMVTMRQLVSPGRTSQN